jgi:hypothetical protein
MKQTEGLEMNLYELDEYDDITETICDVCGDTLADWELDAGMEQCFICETLAE